MSPFVIYGYLVYLFIYFEFDCNGCKCYSDEPDQTLFIVAPDLGLYNLSISFYGPLGNDGLKEKMIKASEF